MQWDQMRSTIFCPNVLKVAKCLGLGKTNVYDSLG